MLMVVVSAKMMELLLSDEISKLELSKKKLRLILVIYFTHLGPKKMQPRFLLAFLFILKMGAHNLASQF